MSLRPLVMDAKLQAGLAAKDAEGGANAKAVRVASWKALEAAKKAGKCKYVRPSTRAHARGHASLAGFCCLRRLTRGRLLSARATSVAALCSCGALRGKPRRT